MTPLDPPLEPLAILLALEELRGLKARYFRLLDTKDFDAFDELFTVDFRYLDDAKGIVLEGRAAFVAFIRERHARSVSVHLGHDPELRLVSAEEAHGIWAMTDHVILPGEGNARRVQRGAGHYRDRYRRESGRWCIAESHLSRLWLIVQHQEEEFAHVG